MAREHWEIPLNEQVDVFLWPRESWDRLVRERPEMRDVLAFVRGGDQDLIINHAGCVRTGVNRIRQILVHEYTHIHLGRMMARWANDASPNRLPRWFEEGLAMAVSDQLRWRDTMRLRWLGPKRLIPLMDLAEDFPHDPERQRLAYLESADAVAHLLDEPGELAHAIDTICDPTEGPAYVASVWNHEVVAGLERRWHATLRLGWRWMLIFTTGGFLWGIVMAVAAIAWVQRRRNARRKIARWAMEAEGLIPAGLDDDEQDEAIRRLLNDE
jgi:hypothetical protein